MFPKSKDPKETDLVGALLRLKRHEKPQPEFWDTFDKQLKQRLLLKSIKPVSRWERIRKVFFPQRLLWAISASTACLVALLSSLSPLTTLQVSNTEKSDAPTIAYEWRQKHGANTHMIASKLTSSHYKEGGNRYLTASLEGQPVQPNGFVF